MNGLYPEMSVSDLNKISMLGLAHVGDAVYELLVRSRLCSNGPAKVTQLHKLTVSYVNAPAQAKGVRAIMSTLDTEELSVYKRARNAKVNSVPHSADIAEYHAATGLEALFGWLYLSGKTERINELFELIMEALDHAT